MKYYAHYEKNTNADVIFYPDAIYEFKDIPTPNIEVTEEDFEKAIDARSLGSILKVVKDKLIIEEKQEPTLEEKQEQWRTFLKSQYDAERVRLGTLLLMANDDEEEIEIKAQRIALKVKYEANLAKVEQGINPFEETE